MVAKILLVLMNKLTGVWLGHVAYRTFLWMLVLLVRYFTYLKLLLLIDALEDNFWCLTCGLFFLFLCSLENINIKGKPGKIKC